MPAEQVRFSADLVVVIPVYNHVATIAKVITGVREHGARVLVIDDGSTDGSGDAARAAGADLRTLPKNSGKGVALRAGLAWAIELGFTRALTCDADGQHPLAAILALVSVAPPAAPTLILGVRDMASAPLSSRIGRTCTSAATWLACGCWPADNQTGLRIYPLPLAALQNIRAARYSFEVEALIRAVRAGVTVLRVPVPVLYPADRISHFHVVRDTWRTIGTFARVILLAPCERHQLTRYAWRNLLRTGLTPPAISCACALGAAIGIAPIPGLQLLVAAWFAVALRLNLPITLLASNVSFGPLLVFWFGLEIAVGRAVRSNDGRAWTWPTNLAQHVQDLQIAITDQGMWATLRPWLSDWLLGSVMVMPVIAVLAGTVGYAVARLARSRQPASNRLR